MRSLQRGASRRAGTSCSLRSFFDSRRHTDSLLEAAKGEKRCRRVGYRVQDAHARTHAHGVSMKVHRKRVSARKQRGLRAKEGGSEEGGKKPRESCLENDSQPT